LKKDNADLAVGIEAGIAIGGLVNDLELKKKIGEVLDEQ